MKIWIVCLSLFLAGCGSSDIVSSQQSSQATPRQPFAPATVARLEDVLARTRAKIAIPGVIVSVSVPGEGLWESSLGVEDKATQLPMKAGMHTRIGSITKTFTITAVLLLVDDGKLQLDDPISKYLDFVPNGANISLRQMANMTSGLFSYTQDKPWVAQLFANPFQVFTARQLVDVGLARQPHFPPGTDINYCNSNTVLLGMVVEKVSGQKIQDFIASRILQPLHLTHTSWPGGTELPSPFSHGYTDQTPDGKETEATFHNPSWGNAAGQMISDLEDLKIWAVALGEGTLLKPETQKQRLTWLPFTPVTFSYGLGIGLFNGWVGHTGELPGYNTGVYYLPAKRAVIVIQTNTDVALHVGTDELNPVPALFREIAKIMTPDNIPDGVEFLPGEVDGANF